MAPPLASCPVDNHLNLQYGNTGAPIPWRTRLSLIAIQYKSTTFPFLLRCASPSDLYIKNVSSVQWGNVFISKIKRLYKNLFFFPFWIARSQRGTRILPEQDEAQNFQCTWLNLIYFSIYFYNFIVICTSLSAFFFFFYSLIDHSAETRSQVTNGDCPPTFILFFVFS